MIGTRRRRGVGLAAFASLALILTACGGGSSGDSGTSTPPGTGTTAASGSAAGSPSGVAPSSGGAATESAAATSPVDTLTIANAVKVDTLDPAENSLNETIWMDQNICSRLVQADPTGTKILPDLAESWDISSDGLTYTFHLRDAKFSDGTPVTAQDAA